MADANRTTKTCSRCKIERSRDEFYPQKDKKDGLTSHCKSCKKVEREKNSDKIKAYLAEYRAKNRDALLEKAKQARRADPEKQKQIAKAAWQRQKGNRYESRKKWEAENREYIRAASRATYYRNVEKYREKNRAHYAANKELYRARDRNRHALELKVDGSHTAEEILMLLASQEGLCSIPSCRIKLVLDGPDKFHADHMVPLSRGGTNYIANIQLLCPTCNKSKGAKTMDEYIEWLRVTTQTCSTA